MARKRRIVKVTVAPIKNNAAEFQSELQFPASEVVRVYDHHLGKFTQCHAGALSKSNHWLMIAGERFEILEMDIELSDDDKS
jgi:hypothetical protein